MTENGVSFDYFASYAHRDNGESQRVNDFLGRLDTELTASYGLTGAPTRFLDYERIQPNQADFRDPLIDGIHASRVLLIFLTPNYLESDWCGKEFEVFREGLQERRRQDQNVVFVLDFYNLWFAEPSTLPLMQRNAILKLRDALQFMSGAFPFYFKRKEAGYPPKALFPTTAATNEEQEHFTAYLGGLAARLASEIGRWRLSESGLGDADKQANMPTVYRQSALLIHSNSKIALEAGTKLKRYLKEKGIRDIEVHNYNDMLTHESDLGDSLLVHILGPQRDDAAQEFERTLSALSGRTGIFRIALGSPDSNNDSDIDGSQTSRFKAFIREKGFCTYEEFTDEVAGRLWIDISKWLREQLGSNDRSNLPRMPSVLISYDPGPDAAAAAHVYREIANSSKLKAEMAGSRLPQLELFDGVVFVMAEADRNTVYQQAVELQKELVLEKLWEVKVSHLGIYFNPKHYEGFRAQRTIPYEWKVDVPAPYQYPSISHIVSQIAETLSSRLNQ